MAKSAHPERETQNRIIKFFQKELGYKYLGNLENSENYNVAGVIGKLILQITATVMHLLNLFKMSLTRFSQIFLNLHITPIKKFIEF